MDNVKNQEILMLARSYLGVYADRYNTYFPDSRPTYSGFCDWAEKHEKECSPLEKRVLKLFLDWLEEHNTNANRRLNIINKPDVEDFINENDQSILLAPLTLSQ